MIYAKSIEKGRKYDKMKEIFCTSYAITAQVVAFSCFPLEFEV